MEFGMATVQAANAETFFGVSPLEAANTGVQGTAQRLAPLHHEESGIIRRCRFRANAGPGGAKTDTMTVYVGVTAVATFAIGPAVTTGLFPVGARIKPTDLISVSITGAGGGNSALANTHVRLEIEVVE